MLMSFLEFMIKHTHIHTHTYIYMRNSMYFILLQDTILKKNKGVDVNDRPLVCESWGHSLTS